MYEQGIWIGDYDVLIANDDGTHSPYKIINVHHDIQAIMIVKVKDSPERANGCRDSMPNALSGLS